MKTLITLSLVLAISLNQESKPKKNHRSRERVEVIQPPKRVHMELHNRVYNNVPKSFSKPVKRSTIKQ